MSGSFSLYDQAIYGGAQGDAAKGIFWTFVILSVIMSVVVGVQAFKTLPDTDTISTDQDGDMVLVESDEGSTENKFKIAFFVTGLLSLAVGVLLGFSDNSKTAMWSRIMVMLGTGLEVISLMLARKNKNLSSLKQAGYNVTIVLLLLQIGFGTLGVSNINETYGGIGTISINPGSKPNTASVPAPTPVASNNASNETSPVTTPNIVSALAGQGQGQGQ